jgi:hypothetical protein
MNAVWSLPSSHFPAYLQAPIVLWGLEVGMEVAVRTVESWQSTLYNFSHVRS